MRLRLRMDWAKVELQDWNLRSRAYKASRRFFLMWNLEFLELRIWR